MYLGKCIIDIAILVNIEHNNSGKALMKMPVWESMYKHPVDASGSLCTACENTTNRHKYLPKSLTLCTLINLKICSNH